MTETEKVLVRELSKDRLDEFLRFFDNEAFSNNPWWKGCYCMFLEDPCPDSEWDASEKDRAKHRAAKAERIGSGQSHGFLAYVKGEVAGWCNAAPRASYVNMRRFSVAVEDPREPVGSITCFIVKPAFRRKGVATALLNAALKGSAAGDCRWPRLIPRLLPVTMKMRSRGRLRTTMGL